MATPWQCMHDGHIGRQVCPPIWKPSPWFIAEKGNNLYYTSDENYRVSTQTTGVFALQKWDDLYTILGKPHDKINFDLGAPSVALTSVPLQSSGSFCSGPVLFTCQGTEIGANLFWLVNGTIVASYGFNPIDTFPLILTFIDNPLHGVRVEVTKASRNTSSFDITSTFNINDVSSLNGSSIQCEEASGAKSELLHVVTTVLGEYGWFGITGA